MQTILSGFLAAGLLQIGDDDEKLQLLESASSELAKQIKAAPILMFRFALVGLDETVSAADPVHRMTEKAVVDKWQTIANKIGSSAIQVYRAVILRAIEIAASGDKNLGLAFALIVANQSKVVAQREQKAIEALLQQFEQSGMREIDDVWVNTVDLSFPKLSAKVKKPQFNKDELIAALARAVGPSDKDGKALPNPNPHWPNTGQPWSHEFPVRAAEAISNAYMNATKAYIEEVQEAVREGVQALANGVDRLAIRDAKSELLWIRTSLYSPSASRSYRALGFREVALHAALDSSRAVKSVAPVSVAFFVRELVRALNDKKVRVADTVKSLAKEIAALPETQPLLKDPLEAVGRRGLLDCAVRSNSAETFEAQTGLDDGYQEPLPDLAVRLYREFQILKLLCPAP